MATEDNKNDQWMTPKDHRDKNHVYRCRSREELANESLMKAWFGNEMGQLEIEHLQSRERPIGEVMDSLFQSWNQEDRVELRQIIEKWEDIIGAEYARSTRPRRILNQTLEVEVFNQAVRFKLNMVKPMLVKQILERVNSSINNVTFITGGQSTSRPS